MRAFIQRFLSSTQGRGNGSHIRPEKMVSRWRYIRHGMLTSVLTLGVCGSWYSNSNGDDDDDGGGGGDTHVAKSESLLRFPLYKLNELSSNLRQRLWDYLGVLHLVQLVHSETLFEDAWMIRPSPWIYLFGNNRHGIISPMTPDLLEIRDPTPLPYAEATVIGAEPEVYQGTMKELKSKYGHRARDVSLAKDHAVLVDASGNVYQWGYGFNGYDPSLSSSSPLLPFTSGLDMITQTSKTESIVMEPICTLKGCDIIQVTTSMDKAIALPRDGQGIYLLPGKHVQPLTSNYLNTLRLAMDSSSKGRHSDVQYLELKSILTQGERIVKASAGLHHLLVLTDQGHVWSTPLDSHGQYYGQCGHTPYASLSETITTTTRVGASAEEEKQQQQQQQNPRNAALRLLDTLPMMNPVLLSHDPRLSPQTAASVRLVTTGKSSAISDRESGAFDLEETTIEDLPFLPWLPIVVDAEDGVPIDVAAGAEHSLLHTSRGAVYGFGHNLYGQLNLSAFFDGGPEKYVVSHATRLPLKIETGRQLLENYYSPNASEGSTSLLSLKNEYRNNADPRYEPKERSWKAVKIWAGGYTSAFLLASEPHHRQSTTTTITAIDEEKKGELYTCGYGLFGQLGDHSYRQYQPLLVPVASLHSMHTYNETYGRTEKLGIKDLSLGDKHVIVTLNNGESAPEPITKEATKLPHYGLDVYTWGANQFFQLGNHKRAPSNVPLKPLATGWLSSSSEYLLNMPTLDASKQSTERATLVDVGLQLFPGLTDDQGRVLLPPQRIKAGVEATVIY